MGYWLFAIIAIGLIVVYGIVIMLELPGLAKERMGELEPLPDNLDEWVIDQDSNEARGALARGLQRETRLWKDPVGGFLGRERVLRQTRYRNLTTGEIEANEPDQRYRRRRVRGA